MIKTIGDTLTAGGFHAGELAVQQKAGVAREASRLAGMLAPVTLRGGIAAFLSDRTFAALTARDAQGRLWTSPLIGEPGLFEVASPTTLHITQTVAQGDPLGDAPADQAVGLVVMEFATRRRVRINGTLTHTDDGGLTIEVEQAYGNCPQYIQQRFLLPSSGRRVLEQPRQASTMSTEDASIISTADTFFLGTTHPDRGTDSSHRGGPAGFVRVEGDELWWPDYAGNNMFNSLGNLAVDPATALLFIDFTTGSTLQLSGEAEVEWHHLGQPGDDGGTGRRVRFRTQGVVSGILPGAQQGQHRSYHLNPALT